MGDNAKYAQTCVFPQVSLRRRIMFFVKMRVLRRWLQNACKNMIIFAGLSVLAFRKAHTICGFLYMLHRYARTRVLLQVSLCRCSEKLITYVVICRFCIDLVYWCQAQIGPDRSRLAQISSDSPRCAQIGTDGLI